MKPTVRIFTILTLFFIIVSIIYGFMSYTQAPLGLELVGFPAILMLALMAGMIAVGLHLFAKAHPERPEEDENAEVYQDAGVQGSYAPYSWHPLWLSIGGALVFLGVAAGWWIAALGAIPLLIGLFGWVMEFSVGKHAH